MTYFLTGFAISAIFVIYRLAKTLHAQKQSIDELGQALHKSQRLLNLSEEVRKAQQKTAQMNKEELQNALKPYYRKEDK